MKYLLKKTFGFLVLLSLLLSLMNFVTVAYAADDDDDDGGEGGESAEDTICSEENDMNCICAAQVDSAACCSESDIFFDQISKDTLKAPDKNYIITELAEPISAFDEVITGDNNMILSQVFMKYQCRTYTTEEWDPENPGELKTVYNPSEVTAWVYKPYEPSISCPPDSRCTFVQLLVGQSGTSILKTYIAILYRWAASVVGIVAVLVIVISGIQISVDQGSGEGVTAAKNRIMQSLGALAILFLAALILYTINPTFFQK